MIRHDILNKTLKAFAKIHILYQKNYIEKSLMNSDIIVKNILLTKLNSLKEPDPNTLEQFGYGNINNIIDVVGLEENLIGDVFDFNSLESKEIYNRMMKIMLSNDVNKSKIVKNFKQAYEESLLSFIEELGNLEELRKELEIKNANLPLKTQILESISLDFFMFYGASKNLFLSPQG